MQFEAPGARQSKAGVEPKVKYYLSSPLERKSAKAFAT